MAQTMRLVVLFGGRSAEHEISCVTAGHVLGAIDNTRYQVDAIGISRHGEWRRVNVESVSSTSANGLGAALDESAELLEPSAAVASADVVVPLLHGPMGEDGTVQGLLDLADVPYVGSGVLGSALCMDKAMAKRAASAFEIPQARWRELHVDDVESFDAQGTLSELGPAVFVKPANMGSSVGVSRATTVDELHDAIESAAGFDSWLIIEEGVVGSEIEVGVLGNRPYQASVPGEIVPGDVFYSYQDKYHDGVAQTLIPADLDQERAAEVKELACRAARALRVQGLARVDFFFESPGRGFLLNEVNTMPGFTPISMFPKLWEASGLSYPDLIDRLVELAVERHRHRQAHRSTNQS